MFLAQIIWESSGLQFVEEIACKNNECPDSYKSWDDYPGYYNLTEHILKLHVFIILFYLNLFKGVRYYGRGYIQLSWSYNYKAASLALFNDLRLYTNPNLVSENDENSWGVSFWYWKTQGE